METEAILFCSAKGMFLIASNTKQLRRTLLCFQVRTRYKVELERLKKWYVQLVTKSGLAQQCDQPEK
jgi:hypothetical protein